MISSAETQADGLWTLWDVMHNFQLGLLLTVLEALRNEELTGDAVAALHETTKLAAMAKGRVVEPFRKITHDDRDRVDGLLKAAKRLADTFKSDAIASRAELFTNKLGLPTMYLSDFVAEARTLRETIEEVVRFESFYLYPKEASRRVLLIAAEWKPALDAFKSIEEDVVAGVDCYALGQPTASVFHMMRVLERAIKPLAQAVKLKYDVQQWQTILDQIESAIGAMQKGGKVTGNRAEKLRFLSQAAKEFRFFKDGWRNYASHAKVTYDTPQAESVMVHVREFMNHLATTLRE